MEGPSTAVIGMGINLNLPDKLKQQIDQPVTDLTSVFNDAINPNHLLAILLKHLSNVLIAFEQGGFAALRDEWTQHHAYHEQDVRMLMPDGRQIHGVVQGITEDGSLLVTTAEGIQRFISGEISLRGL
jgi:BirA family biotin operon repressor/biotin-[acetyl-CoA-carboxylase] ligase